jgi:hypothetical protein
MPFVATVRTTKRDRNDVVDLESLADATPLTFPAGFHALIVATRMSTAGLLHTFDEIALRPPPAA